MLQNKVGLEAEYLLRNKDGELVFPGDYGFTTDEYVILGEFRGEPGNSPAETCAFFLKEYYDLLSKAKKAGLTVDISGWTTVDNPFSARILRKMGTKVINESSNIYGTDILELSDEVFQDGQKIGKHISCGLHVHFSSLITSEQFLQLPQGDRYYYIPVVIPLSIQGAETTITLYRRNDSDTKPQTERKVSASVSRITKPVINYFVQEFDKILPEYVKDMPELKYRKPGYYEVKPHGFEYRSLPFSEKTLKDILEITTKAFNLLESL